MSWYPIRYPRRVPLRRALRVLGRAAISLLSETTVRGQDNVPSSGPLIVVGNEAGVMPPILLAVYCPWPVEMVVSRDLPLDPASHWLMEVYGAIPILPGQLDRRALNTAVRILKQGGVIALFPEANLSPEGGPARAGVAWLSQRAQAPVLPVGFGGVHGAFGATLRLEHPRMTVTIGRVLPPVADGDSPRRVALNEAATRIMAEVLALIPEKDRWRYEPTAEGPFDFEVVATNGEGQSRLVYDEFAPEERAALGVFFSRPQLLATFQRHLRLPVSLLRLCDSPRDPGPIADAADAITNYVEAVNPHFFHYRFGDRRGGAMLRGLRTLAQAARIAQAQGELIHLRVVTPEQ